MPSISNTADSVLAFLEKKGYKLTDYQKKVVRDLIHKGEEHATNEMWNDYEEFMEHG